MMRPIPIYLAVEDELSEWVARRILKEREVEYVIGPVFRRGGFGYLKKNIRSFSNAAKGCPILLLTDLDKYPCPPELVTDWTVHPLHQNLLLRVAVREVESWLLGDGNGLSAFMRLKRSVSIPNPENLSNPKEELLRHALKSPSRQIRDALVWRDERTERVYQGPDYNGTLGRFVANQWDIPSACSRCNSLERLFTALQRLEDRL
ncbi:MAG: DUF4276 family protein [Acidobacteria bacterium]|nr:DUF4276 family protein [Acidobacteriota bacterium]